MSNPEIQARMHFPNLPDTIDLVLESHSNRLKVAMPGKVTKYNKNTHKATVQPLVQYQIEGGETRSLAPISGVPVVHPRTAKGAVFLPMGPGDSVILLVADRDISAWKAGSGQESMPNIIRAHDLIDCWAIPGGYPDGLAPKPRFPDSLEMWLPEGGTFAIGNGTDEFLAIMDEFMDYVETQITFGNGGGPTGPPANSPLLTAIRAKLKAMKA